MPINIPWRRHKSGENIRFVLNSTVTEILGQDRVESVTLHNRGNRCEDSRLEVDGVFLAIGVAPDNEMFRGQLELDEGGYLIAEEDCRYQRTGGGLCGGRYSQQAPASVGDGCCGWRCRCRFGSRLFTASPLKMNSLVCPGLGTWTDFFSYHEGCGKAIGHNIPKGR